MPTSVLTVLGTGSLAAAVCSALPLFITEPTEVVIVGRRSRAVDSLVYRAGARATVLGSPLRFTGTVAGFSSSSALGECLPAEPGMILALASLHSPWEGLRSPSAWTDLVRTSGFGVTLPLQAALALRAAQARPGVPLVNGCFPDAVNPVLSALGHAVVCGVGNAGLMAASVAAALGITDPGRLHVLAHHVHLHEAPAGQDVRVWLDGTELDDTAELLAAQRATDRHELNDVTGLTAAQTVAALLEERSLATHTPGPAGLPGGYPVAISGGEISLRLPPGLDLDSCIRWNAEAGLRDGLRLGPDWAEYGAGRDRIAFRHIDDEIERLASLRTRLRALPAGTDPRSTP